MTTRRRTNRQPDFQLQSIIVQSRNNGQVSPQIDATDRQIDWLVYELYGLTEEEIGIVEGGG